MNFKEAYKAMQEGKKVRRKGWSGYFFYSMNRIFQFVHETQFKPPVDKIALENALAEDWEIVEQKKEKKKHWEPPRGEKYYYISIYKEGANGTRNDEDYIDSFNFSVGNYFKNKIEVEHMIEKFKVIHELQKFAYENNEEEIEWNNFIQYKFSLIYDNEDKEICIDYYCYSKNNPFNIYFTSAELAKQAIEEIGEDRIKKYYFDVEE